jgi:hypothetical protein
MDGSQFASFLKRATLILVGPLAVVSGGIVLSLVFIPLLIWSGIVWTYCWARLKLCGTPIPPKGPTGLEVPPA